MTTTEQEKPPAEADLMRFMTSVRTSLAESLSGVFLRGARSVPIGNAEQATAQPTTSPGRLVGWSVTEVAAASAEAYVRLYDGPPADGGALVATIKLDAASSSTQSLSPGPGLVRGLYVEVVTGEVEGAVWLGSLD